MGNSKSKAKEGKGGRKKTRMDGVALKQYDDSARKSQFSMALHASNREIGKDWDLVEGSSDKIRFNDPTPLSPPLKVPQTRGQMESMPPPQRTKPVDDEETAVKKMLEAEIKEKLDTFFLKQDPMNMASVDDYMEIYIGGGREALDEALVERYQMDLDMVEKAPVMTQMPANAHMEQVPAPFEPPKRPSNVAFAGKPPPLFTPPAIVQPSAVTEYATVDDDEEQIAPGWQGVERVNTTLTAPIAVENTVPDFMKPTAQARTNSMVSNGSKQRKNSYASNQPRKLSHASNQRKLSAASHQRKESVVSNRRKASAMSTANIGGEAGPPTEMPQFMQPSDMAQQPQQIPTDEEVHNPHRPTKFGAAVLPQDVSAQFQQLAARKRSEVDVDKILKERKKSHVPLIPQNSLQRKFSHLHHVQQETQAPAMSQLQQQEASNIASDTLQRKFSKIKERQNPKPKVEEAQDPTTACNNYRLNMSGKVFGECVCGFPKAAHDF